MNAMDEEEEKIEEPDLSQIEKREDTSALQTFQIRPSLEEKFKTKVAKNVIHNILQQELGGKTYNADEAEVLSKSIATTIKNRIKDLSIHGRYKLMVQVIIGEQHGAGIKTASRCLWDADSDAYATDVFVNDSLFCMAVVFAVYFY